jgi:prepilin-type N-terminal cleavage/methylation domain-containing protein
MILKNKKGFSLLELLVAMTIATVILTISLQIFESGMKVKNEQTESKEVDSNLRLAMDYIRDDITQAGAFLGDQGYFNYAMGTTPPAGTPPNRQFCIDFDSNSWADFPQMQAAWQSRFAGWTLENLSEDIIQIWYGDANAYSRVKQGGNIQSLVNFDIEDNPNSLGFQKGDYILFYDASKDDSVGSVRGTSSSTNWLTVLTGINVYTGEMTRGQLLFDQALSYADYYKTDYGQNIVIPLPGKDSFTANDRIYLIHRVVYGVMSKTVTTGAKTNIYKMIIRDNFRDPTGSSRYNPQIIATDIEHLTFTTVFKLPSGDIGSYPESWYNSVRLAYHDNSTGKMFGTTLYTAIDMNTDVANNTLTDHDPRDIRSVIVEICGKSRKQFFDHARAGGGAPKVFFTPEMGVVNYQSGGKDIRYQASSTPDWYKHYKLSVKVGLRTLRMKDFAVNPHN